MAKEESVRVDGTVIDVMPNATFKINLENGTNTILGYLSGRLRQNEIRILLGDKVSVELSPYDLTRGRIVKRL